MVQIIEMATMKNNMMLRSATTSKCSVFSCQNSLKATHIKRPSLYYFPFPKDEIVCESWKQFCNKYDNDYANAYVCSDHFTPNDFLSFSDRPDADRKPRFLKKNAIPTIYKPEFKFEESSMSNISSMHQPGDVQYKTSEPNMPREDKYCFAESCSPQIRNGSRANGYPYYPFSLNFIDECQRCLILEKETNILTAALMQQTKKLDELKNLILHQNECLTKQGILVEKLSSRLLPSSTPEYKIFPLKRIEDIHAAEELLKNIPAQDFNSYVKSLIGQDDLRKCLTLFFTNELLLLVDWDGYLKKYPLKNCKLFSHYIFDNVASEMIFPVADAVKTPDFGYSDYENEMKSGIRTAKNKIHREMLNLKCSTFHFSVNT